MNILFTSIIAVASCCLGVSIGISIANDRNRLRKQEGTVLEVEDFDHLGEELMRTRKKIGIKAQEADKKLGAALGTVRNIEQVTSFISFRGALKYAHLLGIDKIIIHLKA